MMMYRFYARLKKADINKIQTLEKEISKIVLAYEPERDSPFAHLSDQQLRQIQQMENEWNVILVAYQPD